MNKIEKYVENVVARFDSSKAEKEDLKLQFLDHITSLKGEYLQKGYPEEEAVRLAIKDFGSQEQLSSVFSSNKPIMKELLRKTASLLLFAYLFPLFARLIFISNYDSTVLRFRLTNLIPFYRLHWVLKTAIYDHNIVSIDILSASLWFIPVGMLIPFVINKPNSVKAILKVFVIFVVSIQVLKFIFSFGIGNIDYAIIHFIGCLIGFLIYELITKLDFVKGIFFKKELQ